MKLIDDIRRDNIALLVEEHGSAVALSNKLNRDASQVSQWLNGSKHSVTGKPRGMRKETARFIEEKCGKPIGWLDVSHEGSAQGLEPPPPPSGAVFYLLDVKAACGDGRQGADYPEIVRAIALSEAEAQYRIGNLNKSGSVQVIVATGDSMTPSIQPRDLLFVDTAITEFAGDGIYLLFQQNNGLICKRLSMAGRKLTVSSDNTVTPSWEWDDRSENDRIVGRVLAALPMTFKPFY